MKQLRSICILFLLLFSLAGGLFAKGGYQIKVKVNGFSGKKVLIAYHFGDKQYIADTLKRDAEGFFTFQNDSLIRPGIYLFVLPPKNNYFEFLIDNDNQQFTIETDSADMVGKIKITNSKVNQLFYEDIKFINSQRKKVEELQAKMKDTKDSSVIKKLQAELKGIDNSVKTARKKLIEQNPKSLYAAILRASQEPEVPEAPKDAKTGKPLDSLFAYKYYKAHYWDEIDFNDDRLLRTPLLNNKINYYMDKLVIPHYDSLTNECIALALKTINNKLMYQYFVVTLLNKYASSKIMGQDAVYVHIVEEFYMKRTPYWSDTAQTNKIINRAKSLRPTILGAIAPELRIMDMNDNWTSMQTLKADYTVLYFWDYDCSHCKKVTPKLQKVVSHYLKKGANLKVYTVEINGTREKFKESIKEYGLDIPGVINTADPTRITGFDKLYDILSTPRIFLLDKDKKIVAKYISAKQLDELLNRSIYKKDNAEVLFDDKDEDEKHEDKH